MAPHYMNQCCRAKGCKNNSNNCRSSFFKFPLDSRKEAWIRYADRPEYFSLSPGQLRNKKLCDAHFAPNAFTARSRYYLKRNAVPTVRRKEPSDGGPKTSVLQHTKRPSDVVSTHSGVPATGFLAPAAKMNFLVPDTPEIVSPPQDTLAPAERRAVERPPVTRKSSGEENRKSPHSPNNVPPLKALKAVPQTSFAQPRAISTDVVIPNILASLPPALVQMVTNSAGKGQPFIAPQSAVQFLVPQSPSVFTPASVAPTTQPPIPALLPGPGGTHLFGPIRLSSVASGVVPNVVFNIVPQKMLTQLPVVGSNSQSLTTKHGYINPTKVRANALLERMDRTLEDVEKKIRRMHNSTALVKRKYFKLKSYLKHLNELRKAKGLPMIMFEEDLKDIRIARTTGDGTNCDKAQHEATEDISEGVDTAESVPMPDGVGAVESVEMPNRVDTSEHLEEPIDTVL